MGGKAIPQSDDTYMTTVQLRKKFVQLKKMLSLQPVIKTDDKEQIEQLENAIIQLQKDNMSNKIVAETMTKKVNQLENKLTEMTNEMWNLSIQVQPSLDAIAELKWQMYHQKKPEEKDESI